MIFNSLHFMVFFPIVLLIYYVIPMRARYIWLLICSVYFYMAWNPKYVILLGVSVITTYVGGLVISNIENKVHRKAVLIVFIAINIGLLVYFKYSNFLISIFGQLVSLLKMNLSMPAVDIILPVGISFYTFQAVGYLIDVYNGKVKSEKNILKYALFVSFFPQLVAGPIERTESLLFQISECTQKKIVSVNKIYNGALYMIWGFFLKMVIADKIAIIVNQIFDKYYLYGTIELFIGMVAFAIQIYCDFAGYSIIAIGAAEILGFSIIENFNAPYFAMGIKDFWRRWHISLSKWFRDYVYIPLGGNRKGKVRKYINLMITMLLSGLWHGAGFNYILWGGLHGIYQIVEDMISEPLGKICKKYRINRDNFSYKFGGMIFTFLQVCLAWVFFRANSVLVGISYVNRMFTKWNPWVLTDGTLVNLGIGANELNVLVVAIIVLVLMDLILYKKQIVCSKWIASQGMLFQIAWIVGIVLCIFAFGAYGWSYSAQQFLYFQF